MGLYRIQTQLLHAYLRPVHLVHTHAHNESVFCSYFFSFLPHTRGFRGRNRRRLAAEKARRAVVVESPRSLATGDGFADDMDPFMALMRSRQPPCVEIREPSQKPAMTGTKMAAGAVTAVVAEDATISAQNVGEESGELPGGASGPHPE